MNRLGKGCGSESVREAGKGKIFQTLENIMHNAEFKNTANMQYEDENVSSVIQ